MKEQELRGLLSANIKRYRNRRELNKTLIKALNESLDHVFKQYFQE
jgi:hypothetical protein